MKFKFAALAGCGIATLLASAPATAQEVVVPDAQTPGMAPTGLEVLFLDAGANTNDRVLSINYQIVDDPLAHLTPLTFEADFNDTSVVLARPPRAVSGSSGPLIELTQVSERSATASAEPTDHRGGDRGWLSEVRLGLLAQDSGPIVNSVESGAAVNFEVLFNSPEALSGIGSPRPHVGISLATDSYATSYGYAGLTWQHDFWQNWFLVGGFGLALHNGRYLDKADEPVELWHRQKTLGCRVDFHWGVGAGRRLSRQWNVALHYEHVSSGDVCIQGALGLENIGVRVGRVF